MDSRTKLTRKIKNKAKEIGFDLVGITSADPFSKAYQRLKSREISEFMDHDLEKITTPTIHLKEAKSIIALALSYAVSDKIKDKDQYISLYARGSDYHQVIKAKMKRLVSFLSTLKDNVKTICYSDTGSLLDREVAARAGLGWIGKNNNLINPEYGSYLILGEIITDLKLSYDSPIKNRCSNCELCLNSCPTGALNKAHNLKPEKCLSFLTQKKGILKENERKSIFKNLWGCDSCLQVCPYNKNIPTDLHQEFKPVLKGDIKQVLSFSKNSLPDEWKKSALYWRGLRILKRNSLINIGNNGNNVYTPIVKKYLKNPSPVLRAYAVWALG
ncbi:MAG: tRNA epoxyqueuosine(34) reductase QueG, partial [Halanaerobiales bacterium]